MLAQPPATRNACNRAPPRSRPALSHATSPAILVDQDVDQYSATTERSSGWPGNCATVRRHQPDQADDRRDVPLLADVLQRQGRRAVHPRGHREKRLPAVHRLPADQRDLGDFTASLPADTIRARGHSFDIGEDNYQAVTLKDVLRGVMNAVPQVTSRPRRARSAAAAAAAQADGSAKLTQAAYWQALQGYLRPGDVLFTDNGTSYAIFGFRLPPDCTVSRVGHLGVDRLQRRRPARHADRRTAAPPPAVRGRRLVPGDRPGAVDHAAARLQAGHLPDQRRADTPSNAATWARPKPTTTSPPGPTRICRRCSVRTPRRDRSSSKTVADLHNALSAPNDTLIFIESIMDPHDAPAAVIQSSNNGAELDYDFAGPQHRANAQLQPA